VLVTVVVLTAVPGCPEKQQQLSGNYLKGKVTMQNKPVMGDLTFTPTDGKKGVTTRVMGDGNYLIENPPMGQCKITMSVIPGVGPPPTFEAPPPMKDMKEKTEDMMKKTQNKSQEYVYPPAKYATPDNGLKPYEIKPGRQEHDIQLQP